MEYIIIPLQTFDIFKDNDLEAVEVSNNLHIYITNEA